jgi:hypothetical protein
MHEDETATVRDLKSHQSVIFKSYFPLSSSVQRTLVALKSTPVT